MLLRDEHEIIKFNDFIYVSIEKTKLEINEVNKIIREHRVDFSIFNENASNVLHVESKDILKKNLEELNLLSLQKELEDWLDGKVSD